MQGRGDGCEELGLFGAGLGAVVGGGGGEVVRVRFRVRFGGGVGGCPSKVAHGDVELAREAGVCVCVYVCVGVGAGVCVCVCVDVDVGVCVGVGVGVGIGIGVCVCVGVGVTPSWNGFVEDTFPLAEMNLYLWGGGGGSGSDGGGSDGSGGGAV